MVHHFLASPFDEAPRAAHYAAVLAALQADLATDSLLLGNLVLEDGAAPIDALVVRAHSLSLLVLVPRGGALSIPALGYGAWQLAGTPLPGADNFDNPYEQFAQQKKAVEDWLRPRFSAEQANLHFISGLVLFAGPVEFAPNVEPALNGAVAGFQLLSDAAELPRRLRQLATPEIDLTPEDLADWAAEWAIALASASPAPPLVEPDSGSANFAASQPRPAWAEDAPEEAGFLAQKARALWGWLGADDVPVDLPYGADASALAARSEEKEHLERLRQQMQADLNGQLQALETREAERERSIAQLRAELAQAPPVAAEATALVSRLGAETREKAALEAEMQASRAESAARNQELDAKIQQLGQLIERLNAPPAAPSVASAAAAASVAVPAVAPVAEATPAVVPAVAPTVPAMPPVVAPLPQLAAEPVATPASPAPGPAPARGPSVLWQARVKAAAGPRIEQLRAWGQGLPKPRLALVVGAVAVLGLGAWGLSHLGASPPVPYQENGRWGFADAKGQPVIPAQFTAAGPFQAGRAVVAKDGAYGVVNEAGQEVVAPAYDALNPYAGGYARARVGEAYTFVDEKGEEFDHYYYNALDFAEGRAAVLDHRGWYYISGPAEPAQPVIFSEAYSFADGLARVKLADGFTFITPVYLEQPEAGTKPFGRYDTATDFADGRAQVSQQGRRFQIDKSGEEVK